MHLLQLMPEFRERVWGGQRLKPAQPPFGEAWIIYEQNRIAAGPLAGRTLAEAAAEQGAALLGEAVVHRTGLRFPLLIKLLDCSDWLSIQVHPDDAQAVQLEGAGHFGKTEAWHILQAEPGARLIAGARPGTRPETLAQAVRQGSVLEHVQYHPVSEGDTIHMPAGTLHALGPGLLLYEVQQTSDLTYRVYDWGRPLSAGRALHLEQSALVARADLAAEHRPLPPLAAHDRRELTACSFFRLEILAAESQPLELDTRGLSFHALTLIEGAAEVQAGPERLVLGCFESAVIPAGMGAYRLQPAGACRALLASVPEQ